MLGANLRQLVGSYASVSEVCRRLGINRTQFNRYLSGESFPRPDVLDRICRFFGVDARILLTALSEIQKNDPVPAPQFLLEFFGADRGLADETPLRGGFYHVMETDPGDRPETRHLLLFARNQGSCATVRAFGPVTPGATPASRELRGLAFRSGATTQIMMGHRGATGTRIYVLADGTAPAASARMGYSVRPGANACDCRKLELRFLGQDLRAALGVARLARS
ncbi:Cro/C1-type HTH DNA-binding domain-containing protein [Ruegeria intermedia]|uniref:Cro/C1-type HTH DNA-binding domain-containing protein n=2 Tax=Ruegeria intermedia TaxID=996115 RepID=A0A1M4UL93_9RHOB|nr:Cro/C1-type HTH DNA-binding domain-containing protein [Ruegeria intermedia]